MIVWDRSVAVEARRRLDRVFEKLGVTMREPLRVEASPRLSNWRGKLESNTGRGFEVHAAGYLRRRRIVLETELLARPGDARRIFVHELGHFVWLRLGNPRRREWEALLESEARGGSRGELGWPAESRKRKLRPRDWQHRTRRWREYACESFCDTAAWACSGLRAHAEFTLAVRWRLIRGKWFEALRARGPLPV